MADTDEYSDPMVAAIELVWGEGNLAPGGDGNIANLLEGLEVRGKRILDIGCGIGGPACTMAKKYGARVVGSDLERNLLRRTHKRASRRGLQANVSAVQVEPGPFAFRDGSFDVVVCSGAFTQTKDKLGIFRECLRVLAPGGSIRAYDWMRPGGEYSEDMLRWFELEGLTYEMETPKRYEELLSEAGFADVKITDRSEWYRAESQAEYERVKSHHYPRMVELIGKAEADRFTEDWRALALVCGKGEMLQVYSEGRKPK